MGNNENSWDFFFFKLVNSGLKIELEMLFK